LKSQRRHIKSYLRCCKIVIKKDYTDYPNFYCKDCTDYPNAYAVAVVPRDSAWFSWFNGTDVVPLHEQDLYWEDWLGLRELDENWGLFFDEIPGNHMQFSPDMLIGLLDKYLS
jgi:hypothetical protein